MLVLLIGFYAFLSNGSDSAERESFGRRFQRGLLSALPYLVIAVIYLAVRGVVIGGLMDHAQIELTTLEVIRNVFLLFASYIGKLLLPVGLNALYEFHQVASVSEPRFIVSVLVTFLFITLFAVLLRRGRGFLSFPLLWILLPILPVLYVPALATVAFADRYLYLPVAGFAIFVSVIFVRLLRAGAGGGQGNGFRWAMIGVITTVLILYTGATLSRIPVWQSNLSLWSDTVAKSPRNPDVRYNLGWTYHELGMIEEARAEYKKTLRLNPSINEARFNLAVIHLEAGDVREAYHELQRLIRINPDYTEASRLIKEIEASAKRGF